MNKKIKDSGNGSALVASLERGAEARQNAKHTGELMMIIEGNYQRSLREVRRDHYEAVRAVKAVRDETNQLISNYQIRSDDDLEELEAPPVKTIMQCAYSFDCHYDGKIESLDCAACDRRYCDCHTCDYGDVNCYEVNELGSA